MSLSCLVRKRSICPTNRSSRPWNTHLSSRSPSRLSTRHSHLCKHVTLRPPQPPSACPSKKKTGNGSVRSSPYSHHFPPSLHCRTQPKLPSPSPRFPHRVLRVHSRVFAFNPSHRAARQAQTPHSTLNLSHDRRFTLIALGIVGPHFSRRLYGWKGHGW